MIGLIDFSASEYNYNHKGYTAIINQAIDIAVDHFIRHNNTDLVISDAQILDYFTPVHTFNKYDYSAANVFLDNFRKNQTRHNIHNAHTPADKDDLRLRHKILNRILSPKSFLTNEIADLLTTLSIDDRTLGIQLRGTDKVTEIPKTPDNIIINSITKTINQYQLSKLFLSTDDNYYLELIKNNFKEILVYNKNNVISYDNKPIHFSENRKQINKDVLLDAYILSNCKYFLHCFSNVSYLALTLGSQNQKYIKNINYED